MFGDSNLQIFDKNLKDYDIFIWIHVNNISSTNQNHYCKLYKMYKVHQYTLLYIPDYIWKKLKDDNPIQFILAPSWWLQAPQGTAEGGCGQV